MVGLISSFLVRVKSSWFATIVSLSPLILISIYINKVMVIDLIYKVN